MAGVRTARAGSSQAEGKGRLAPVAASSTFSLHPCWAQGMLFSRDMLQSDATDKFTEERSLFMPFTLISFYLKHVMLC